MLSKSEANSLSLADFEILKVIGSGTNTQVCLARLRRDDSLYALKAIRKAPDPNCSAKSSQMAFAELEVFRNFQDSPFLVRPFRTFQTESHFFFLLEYCSGGDLLNVIQQPQRLPEHIARFYAGQIVLAFKALHQKGYIYRDLKPENVLLCSNGYVKLGDFGLSKLIGESKTHTLCGTRQYFAPEMLIENQYSFEVDWWSLGCFIFETLTRLPPFFSSDSNKAQLFDKIKFSQPKFPSFFSGHLKDLLSKLLEKDPAKRLGAKGAEEVQEHLWFEGFDWEALRSHSFPAPYIPSTEKLGLINFDQEFLNSEVEFDPSGKPESKDPFSTFDFVADDEGLGAGVGLTQSASTIASWFDSPRIHSDSSSKAKSDGDC